MMGNMPGGSFEQCLQCQRACFCVNAGPLKIFNVRLSEDSGNLASNQPNQIQLFFHIAMVILQCRREVIRLRAEQCGIVFGQDSLHSICIDQFKVRNVANDFVNRPGPRNRMPHPLLTSDPLYAGFQLSGTEFVLLKKFVQSHSAFDDLKLCANEKGLPRILRSPE